MVNITDISKFEADTHSPKTNYFVDEIFERQTELLEKYRVIEKIPENIDIHLAEHQQLLKNLTFRGIEELAEAYEGFLDKNYEHVLEEISDAIHFFTEVLILLDVDAKEFQNIKNTKSQELNLENLDYKLWAITYNFSIACNRLKCKPWKQSEILTDVDRFTSKMVTAYREFLESLVNNFGLSHESILDLYRSKNLVNKFRIRSKY